MLDITFAPSIGSKAGDLILAGHFGKNFGRCSEAAYSCAGEITNREAFFKELLTGAAIRAVDDLNLDSMWVDFVQLELGLVAK